MSPLSKVEMKTIEHYDNQEGWISWLNSKLEGREEGVGSFWKDQMEHFTELLPIPAKVLEIGVGPGFCAGDLMRFGYDYVGVDPSRLMLEETKRRNPDANLLQTGIHDLCFKGEFDGFWVASTLLHIQKGERTDEALSQIKGVIRDGGIGFITMKEGDKNESSEKTGCWNSFYSESEFVEVLERNGMEIMMTERLEKPGFSNAWLIFFVRNCK